MGRLTVRTNKAFILIRTNCSLFYFTFIIFVVTILNFKFVLLDEGKNTGMNLNF